LGTAILTIVLGGLAFFIAYNDPDPTIPFWLRLLFPIMFGGLGLLIGVLAIRHIQGKRSKYVEYADEDSAENYICLGVLDKTSLKYVKNISDSRWVEIKNYKMIDIPKKEKAKSIKLSAKTQKIVNKIRFIEKLFLLAIIPGLALFPFIDSLSMFFLMWAWFMAGVWLFTNSLRSLIEGKFGIFTAANNVDFYGWPAKFFAGFMMFIALIIFIVPGLFLMLGISP